MNIFFVFKAITEHFQIPPPQHFTVIFMWRHLFAKTALAAWLKLMVWLLSKAKNYLKNPDLT